MSTPVGVIKKFVKSLMTSKKTGEAAANEAFKAVASITYAAFKAKYESDSYKYDSDQDFLEQACGIRLNNKDTGAITGSDAGGSETKTAESIVPEATKAVNLTNAQYNSFTKNGLKVNIKYKEVDDEEAGENFKYDSSVYLAKQKLVTRALYNWWIPESLDLINESLGVNFTDGRANINVINIEFSNDFWSNYYALALDFDYDLGKASNITLKINSELLYKMTADDKNGTLLEEHNICSGTNGSIDWYSENSLNYLDRLILEAMTEVTLKANLAYVEKLPAEVRGGLYAIVGGYDDYSDYDTETQGYFYLRYLAKQYSDGMPDGLSYNKNKTVLTASTAFTEGTIDLANFASTVKTVDASALKTKVKIVGNSLANSIKGGAGNDTLRGNAGNDTMTGGKGNDVFICGAGAEVITDYATGDKISLTAAATKTSVSGSDVVFTLGKNSLTVKNAAGKLLSMISSKGKSYSTVVGGDSATLTVTNSTKSPVTVSSAVENIDASGRTSAVKITGNALDNIITGGTGNDSLYGGKGKDTLDGGKGNDKLWGDAGADTFLYFKGEGKDTIYGFDNNDMLLITGDFSATYSKNKKEVYFKVGNTSNAITLKQSTATSFNVNGYSYKVSGSKLVRK